MTEPRARPPADRSTRRGVLRGLVAAGGVAAGGMTVAVVGSTPSRADHFASVSGVTREFDEGLLDQTRPMLDVTDTDGVPDLYGFVATRDDEPTTACVFWAEWAVQQGVSTADSHFGDHEPLYVFVDEAGGLAVEEVVYSGYHWLAASERSPPVTDRQHVPFAVIPPWHHYAMAPSLDLSTGSLLDVRHLSDALFRRWLDGGLEDDLAPGVVLDPWRMRDRSSWWRDTAGVPLSEWWQRLRLGLGRDGADRTDL